MSIEELEQLRKKAVQALLIGFFIPFIVGIIITAAAGNIAFIVLFLVLSIAVSALAQRKPNKLYKKEFKNKFVLGSLKTIFTDLVYEPDHGLNSLVVRSAGMTTADRYSSNDFISGKYKDIKVIQADVCIEEEHERRDKDGNVEKYYVTIFEGRWMVFDFNKEFKANMQIREKGFYGAKAKRWGEDKYHKVKMEDVQFNKEFTILAQNEHDAFYILTPRMMERVRQLNANLNGKIFLSFVGNKLHIGLHNGKDSFECSIFRKIDEQKINEEVSREIKIITDCVDELNLDNDLFRKEV